MIQGTRTIIDNTNRGYGVVPINTQYDGFFQCVQYIHATEGFFGFYKGMGSLIIEVFICFSLFKLIKVISLRIYDAEWTSRYDRDHMKQLFSTPASSGSVKMEQITPSNENKPKMN
jgi:hypothetical protein